MEKEVFFQSNKTSLTLEWILSKCDTFDEFEAQCSDDMLNSDCRMNIYLLRLLEKHGKKTSVASMDAKMSPGYLGLIVNGKKHPTRDMLIKVALAIGASVEETQYLMKYAGYAPLYVRDKRDVIIWFGLSKGESLDTVNDNLIKRNLEPLFTDI